MKRKMGKRFRKYWSNLKFTLRYNKLWNIYNIPNHTYRQVKDVFAKPKRRFYFYKTGKEPYIKDFLTAFNRNVIFSCSDFEWKSKWGDYRFEWVPYIGIKLFVWNLIWIWESPNGDNISYYETIMNYLWKYNKNIIRTKENFGWQKQDENGNWVSCWDESILK